LTRRRITTNAADTLALYLASQGFTDKGNNAFTVVSTGTDIWNNSDQFRFAYKSLSGNGSITAKVDSLTRSDAWSKAGVRSASPRCAKHAMAVTPDKASFQVVMPPAARAPTDRPASAPYWVRIPHRQPSRGEFATARPDGSVPM
jgi:hypothetical protein